MSAAGGMANAVSGAKIHMTFTSDKGVVTRALDNVSLEVRRGALTALVGPDGAGKSTLMRLTAGLMTADSGDLSVLGIDVAANPQQVQSQIGYMPQRFGLYQDLSVQENLDLYADLHGIGADERRDRYPRLMEMTALGPFVQRQAGRLSGGMKQKLGLACTLICSPELLLLDEPTVGVDPLSRRELWAIILQLVKDEGLTVLLSTSYLDEAERCGHVIVLHEGKVLSHGRPDEVAELATRIETLQVLESGPQPDHPTPQEDAQRLHRQKELATLAQWHAITSRVLKFLTTTGYLDLLDSAEAGALGDMWRAIARDADQARERLRRLRGRRRRWHRLRYLLYLAVAAILGVVIGAGLALTPVAGFISFAAAALVQAALDRWMITPAIDRRTARQELADLRALAVKCKDFLLKARAAQATMYPVAAAYGAKIEPVLQPVSPGGGSSAGRP